MAKPKNTANKQSAPTAKSYDDLAMSLKNNQIQTLYLLFGEEDYLIEQVIRALARRLIEQGCRDVDMYTADYSSIKPDPERIYELVNTPPFLSSRRLVVIHESGLFSGKAPETPELKSPLSDFSRIYLILPAWFLLRKRLISARRFCMRLSREKEWRFTLPEETQKTSENGS